MGYELLIAAKTADFPPYPGKMVSSILFSFLLGIKFPFRWGLQHFCLTSTGKKFIDLFLEEYFRFILF